jgi:hypothetical protein
MKEFTKGRVAEDELDKLVQTARVNLMSGFEARAPRPEPTATTEEPVKEEVTE